MWLAVAEPTDLSNDSAILVLVGLGLCAAGAVMVALAVALARWRGHRQVGLMGWLAALCALMLVSTVGLGLYQRYEFSAERELMLRTKNYDPSIETRAPVWPWIPTIALSVGYGVILVACAAGGKRMVGGKERRA